MIKLLSLKSKPKKIEINKLNTKMDDLQNKLEMFQQIFAKIELFFLIYFFKLHFLSGC